MPELRLGGQGADSPGFVDKAKDDATSNHEIATLLLNLASRTGHPHFNGDHSNGAATLSKRYEEKNNQDKVAAANNSAAKFEEAAMDLSKTNLDMLEKSNVAKQDKNEQGDAHLTVQPNPYSLFPIASVPSSYLLQNLLIGKMQQSFTPTSNLTISAPNDSNNFAVTTLNSEVADAGHHTSSARAVPPASCSSPLLVPATVASSSSPASPAAANGLTGGQQQQVSAAPNTIPLMAGQIVATLNTLLFNIHGFGDRLVESKLEVQLTAIFARLQEMVAMVQLSRATTAVANGNASAGTTINSPTLVNGNGGGAQQQLSNGRSNKGDNEDLAASQAQAQYLSTTLDYVAKSKFTNGGNKHAEPATRKDTGALNHLRPDSVIESLHQQQQQAVGQLNGPSSSTSTMLLARKLRDGSVINAPNVHSVESSGSPPEKRGKFSPESGNSTQQPINSGAVGTSSTIAPSSSSSSARKTSKGGKGIRNRVFCGDCPGCLKNDDCGQCRYCRDKTKFGGQNRLRQKCLHRRCQMDTHRRSVAPASGSANGSAGTNGANQVNLNGSPAVSVAALGNLQNFSQTTGSTVSGNSPQVVSIAQQGAAAAAALDFARLAAVTSLTTTGGVPVTLPLASDQQQLLNARTPVTSVFSGFIGNGVMANTINLLSATQNAAFAARAGAASPEHEHQTLRITAGESPEPSEASQAGQLSRIDKWKAKHEAMLKAAEAKRDARISIISIPTPPTGVSASEDAAAEAASVHPCAPEDLSSMKTKKTAATSLVAAGNINADLNDDDDDSDGQMGGQDKQGKLVITMSDKEEDELYDEDEFEQGANQSHASSSSNDNNKENNISMDDFRKESNDRMPTRINNTALVV